MDVEYNREIDDKGRLVSLIINQKRITEAATATQRVFRARSEERLERSKSRAGDEETVDVS